MQEKAEQNGKNGINPKKGGNKSYVLNNYRYIFLWRSGFFSKSLEVLHEGTYAFQFF
jgi:hypothetical protein